jgi:hypothetical protein
MGKDNIIGLMALGIEENTSMGKNMAEGYSFLSPDDLIQENG